MYVQKECLEFTIDNDSRIFNPGDIVVILSHLEYGGKALKSCNSP